jgi:hypothetical protein
VLASSDAILYEFLSPSRKHEYHITIAFPDDEAESGCLILSFVANYNTPLPLNPDSDRQNERAIARLARTRIQHSIRGVSDEEKPSNKITYEDGEFGLSLKYDQHLKLHVCVATRHWRSII